MRDWFDARDFTYDELVEYSGEPRGTLGITMLEHLQNLTKCQGIFGASQCEDCMIAGDIDKCYLLRTKSMTEAVLVEMIDLMKKDNQSKENKKITGNRPPTDKQKLLAYVNNLPDDADIFSTNIDFERDGCITIKVFPIPKTADFYKYYFGI